jgi:hypothetical protein
MNPGVSREYKMKIKTDKLIDKALDWAVWACESPNDPLLRERRKCPPYSTNRAESDPLIEREEITIQQSPERDCFMAHNNGPAYEGPTPRIAALRCLVASKLGDEVDVPDELLTASEVASESSSLEPARSAQRPRGG